MSLRIQTNAPGPLLFLLGCAFLAGAAVLAWFSAVVSLQITREAPAGYSAQIENRLFGLVPTAQTRIERIRTIEFVDFRLADSQQRSRSHIRLIFQTAAGAVDEGYAQQQFAQRGTDIRDFLEHPERPQLTIASNDGFHEMFRFLAAQAGVVLLSGFGLLLLMAALQGLFPDPDAGVGPR